MSDVSGIPNLGIPGLSGFNGGGGVNGIPGSSGLASAQDQYLQNLRFFGDQAATQAAAEVPQSQLYGGGSFGAQPAYFAGVGAAYGRAAGNSGSAAVAAEHGTPSPPTQVPVDPSPFDAGNAGAVPYLGTGGGDPFGGGGFGRMPTPFDIGTQGIPNLSGGGAPFGGGGFGGSRPSQTSSYTPSYFDDTFNSNFSPANPTIGFSRGRSMPQGAGYDPGASATLPPGPPQSRFDPQRAIDAVNQFSGVGTVPQESIAPGRNTGGANPFTSGADPIGNLGSPFAAGRGFEATPPSPFDAGAPHIGPTMGPFMSAAPGGGVGRGQPPPSFAPSSPFEGGTSPLNYAGDYRGSMNNQINQTVGFGGEGSFDPSAPPPPREGFGPSSPFVAGAPPVPFQKAGGQAFPVPGIGGYRGSMRDQIAAIMSGSQGMTEPPTSGPPLVNGGPQGTGVPSPSPSQMGDAWGRIGAGRGMTVGATPVPPPEAPYAKINNAIFDIGNASRPGMFDNLNQPLGSMFSPGQYRGAPQPSQPANSPPFDTKAGPISQGDIDKAWYLSGSGGRFIR